MENKQEKKYINPSLEIIIFTNDDVICASELVMYIIPDEDDVP